MMFGREAFCCAAAGLQRARKPARTDEIGFNTKRAVSIEILTCRWCRDHLQRSNRINSNRRMCHYEPNVNLKEGLPTMKIDLARRAEIGRERSARTREQVMNAARTLFSLNGFETVTVDDVVKRSKVARGTFYVHFAHIEDLRAAVADELIRALETISRPERMRATDPLERIAAGSFAFIHQALLNPAWGKLVARAVWSLPTVGKATREDLAEDLRDAFSRKRIPVVP